MIDLAELGIENLIVSVRRSGNSAPLITHLRSGGEISPLLASLIADILAGVVRATPKTVKPVARMQTPTIRAMLKAQIVFYRDMLADPTEEQWIGLRAALASAGYVGVPETRRQQVDAAKLIVRYAYGRLTASQLDEILSPRKARPRKAI